MKCKICKQEAEDKVCATCREFLQWNYPGEKIDDILEKYKEMSDPRIYLKGRKRK